MTKIFPSKHISEAAAGAYPWIKLSNIISCLCFQVPSLMANWAFPCFLVMASWSHAALCVDPGVHIEHRVLIAYGCVWMTHHLRRIGSEMTAMTFLLPLYLNWYWLLITRAGFLFTLKLTGFESKLMLWLCHEGLCFICVFPQQSIVCKDNTKELKKTFKKSLELLFQQSG